MKNVSLSIITITRNNLVELQLALESIQAQNYPNLEVIIVDGASTDGTPDFLRSLKNEKIKWISEPDRGIADAYNKGMKLAGGDLFLFMNAGDEFVNAQTLSQAIALIPDEVNVTESIIYGDYYQITESVWNPVHTDHTKLHTTCSLNHQSAFIGRNIGLRFPYDLRLRMEADYDMWLRCLAAGVPFIKIAMPIAKFHMGGVSSSPENQVHLELNGYFSWRLTAGDP